MSYNKNQIKNELLSNGWCVINAKLNDSELINFSEKFGRIIPDNNGKIIQYLKPKPNQNGIRDSFSYNFGYLSFPFHTDTSFWSIPARYIIMTSENQSNCTTNLFDFNQILQGCTYNELLDLKKSVFVQKTFSEQKFTNLIFQENEILGIRFDPNIMFPYNEYSKKTLDLINSSIQKLKTFQIEWTGNNIVIIDNWRFLHSRGDSTKDKNRILKRIYLS